MATAAAVAVLWMVAAAIAAPLIGAFIRRGRGPMTDPREYEPDPPDYQLPEDDPFAELFFTAARERDEGEDGDG